MKSRKVPIGVRRVSVEMTDEEYEALFMLKSYLGKDSVGELLHDCPWEKYGWFLDAMVGVEKKISHGLKMLVQA